MPIWLQLTVIVVGAFHAVASFFFFSRGRYGLLWVFAWTAVTVATLVWQASAAAPAGFCGAVVAWHVWWATLRPRIDRDWAPELARQTTGVIADGR